jgi:hypothetical protein
MYGILHFRVFSTPLSFFFLFILAYDLHSARVTYARVIPNDGDLPQHVGSLINIFLIFYSVEISCQCLKVLSKLLKAEDVFAWAVILKKALVKL